MRVYRYLSEEELNNMREGNVADLGRDGGIIKIAQRKYKMKRILVLFDGSSSRDAKFQSGRMIDPVHR